MYAIRSYYVSMENFEIVQISSGERGTDPHLGWHKNSAYQFRGNQLIEIKLGKLLDDSEKDAVGDSYNFV